MRYHGSNMHCAMFCFSNPGTSGMVGGDTTYPPLFHARLTKIMEDETYTLVDDAAVKVEHGLSGLVSEGSRFSLVFIDSGKSSCLGPFLKGCCDMLVNGAVVLIKDYYASPKEIRDHFGDGGGVIYAEKGGVNFVEWRDFSVYGKAFIVERLDGQ